MAEAVTVRVRFASIYLDPTWRALPEARAGDIITIAGGSYAQDMLTRGFVEPVEDHPATTPAVDVLAEEPVVSTESADTPPADEPSPSPTARRSRAPLR